MKLHPELIDKRQAHGKMAQVEEVENEDDLEDDLAAAIFNSVLQDQRARAFMITVPKDESFGQQLVHEKSVLNLEEENEFEKLTMEEMDMFDMLDETAEYWDVAAAFHLVDLPAESFLYPTLPEFLISDSKPSNLGGCEATPAGAAASEPLISILPDPQILDSGRSNLGD